MISNYKQLIANKADEIALARYDKCFSLLSKTQQGKVFRLAKQAIGTMPIEDCLLTDEELDDIGYPILPLGDRTGSRRIAKAQLAKVKEAGYVQLAEDQELPPALYDKEAEPVECLTEEAVKQDMFKASWRRVKLAEVKDDRKRI